MLFRSLDKPAFAAKTGVHEVLQVLQRVLVMGSAVWLVVIIAREKMKADREIMLLGWAVIPVVVFVGAQLWTYLSYYAILWPVLFLLPGAVVERGVPGGRAIPVTALALCLGSVLFMTEFYRFIEAKGGAHGTYGSGVGYKLQAARRLAGGQELYVQQRLVQMDQLGRAELAQIDLPFLVAMQGAPAAWPSNQMVLVYDANRANYRADEVPQLAKVPNETFGPMRLYFLEK